MREVVRERKKFGGVTFRRLLSYHSKAEAEQDAKRHRSQGFLVRITSNKLPIGGRTLWHVWIHFGRAK